MSTCKKCGSQGSVTLRTTDFFCNDCFINYINHKFRACIGKNKMLSKNENVLICLSGGLASTVLLDLIYYGISLNNHKKLWIIPTFFHLIGLTGKEDFLNAKNIIENCKKYNFNVYIGCISEYGQNVAFNKRKTNVIPQIDNSAKKHLENLIVNMTLTSKKDFLEKVKRELYIQCAKNLQCNFIFTGETTSTLATNLLSNVSLGRGSQVEHDIGFCDSRNKVKILRPMKDLSEEELQQYVRIKQLSRFTKSEIQDNDLQSILRDFISDLQKNFNSTISTICKTADKIGAQEEMNTKSRCIFCESVIEEKCNQLTALNATNFSRLVSIELAQNMNESVICENESLSMFPHIYKYFCYSCSKNYKEMNSSEIPEHKISESSLAE